MSHEGVGSPSEQVFERLYKQHYGKVLSYCRRRLDGADANDATAEVFATAWRRIDAVPTDGGELPWLYTVAHNVVSRQWRSNSRRTRTITRLAGLAAEPAPTPESIAVSRTSDDEVISAAATLSQRDQEVLRLAAWERLPHADIASILGCSVAAVDQRIHRAKKRLARRLRPEGRASHQTEGGRS